MKHRFILLICTLFAICAGCSARAEFKNQVSADSGRHYTVIVSLDGFRWDYPRMYRTPSLNLMAKEGVSAVMKPSYPASTFPNHYTLATGWVPSHHGIINNIFWDPTCQKTYAIKDKDTRYDPHFYQGEPIWITAQRQGIKVGCMYWIGSDIKIKGTYPSYYRQWDAKPFFTFDQRIDQAIRWLQLPEKERPQLIMLYFEEPDGKGHHFGPRSKETKECVEKMDALMGSLRERLAELPIAEDINLIVLSDHGMTDISEKRVVDMNRYIRPEWCEHISGRTPTTIFPKKGCEQKILNALKGVQHIKVWTKESVPAVLRYGDSPRIGEIIVAPDLGWQFTDVPRRLKGAHGYSPEEKEMQVIFRATGPDFKKGYKAKTFYNTDIYSLLACLLKIQPAPTDGSLEGVMEMLQDPADSQ